MSVITVNAGGNIATAITNSVSGDIIEIEAGATFDVSSPLSLKNHGSSVNPITIRSQNYASLPNGRVNSANLSNMPKIRQTGINGAFVDVAGGAYWVIDGLEVTDNLALDSNFFFDLRNGGKTTITRTYCHPKETNPTWSRAVSRGIWYEGSAGLTVGNSDFRGFLGYDLGGVDLTTNAFLLSISGKNVTLTNNFLSAWYSTIFTGGGGVAAADVTATLSGTPTTTAATVSTTSGLTTGQYVRVEFRGTATKSGSSFTRTGGDVLTAADVANYNTGLGYGLPFVLAEAAGYSFLATAISGNSWTVGGPVFSGLADGGYNWTAYEVVEIDSISGNDLTYHGVGTQAIVATPSAANTRLSWVTGDGSNAADWTITKNEFWKDPAFVNYLISINYSLPQGKGIWEMKHMKRMTLDGNIFSGYPNSVFMRQYNQDGTEPWSTISDLTFTNNYFRTDVGVTNIGGAAFSISLADPYFSSKPGTNVIVSNNLIAKGWESLLFGEGGSDVQYYHNTIINDDPGPSYHSLATFDSAMISPSEFVFRDNIASYRNYGFQCLVGGGALSDCWPSGTWSKNVVVDTESAGVTTSVWGADSALSPVPAAFSQVGFIDQANENFRLTAGSSYKGAGTSGSDPGIDQDALALALGFDPSRAIVRAKYKITVL